MIYKVSRIERKILGDIDDYGLLIRGNYFWFFEWV